MLFIVASLLGLGTQAQPVKYPRLKQQLDSIYVLDQQYRIVLSQQEKLDAIAQARKVTSGEVTDSLWKLQSKIDSSNLIFVENIFKRHGYPGRSMVGESTCSAAWFVIQHSSDAEIGAYLPLMKKAVDSSELDFHFYAMMLDRHLMNAGQEQLYGTQFICRPLKNGKDDCFIWPVKDPDTLNERRKSAGFTETIEEYIKHFHATYRVVKLTEVK